ncbi:MAG: hypothetical protein K8T89_15630 [Planctomycetes bacterium]|nr:hypothetical protein [Planctomycetota bacterium]
MDDPIIRLQSLLDRIAQVILAATSEEMRGQPWVLAYLDVRGQGTTSQSLLQKYRINRTDGTTIDTLDVPDDLMLLLREAFDLKDAVLSNKWHGVLITAFPDRQCEVKFDYDPNCAKDKAFFLT